MKTCWAKPASTAQEIIDTLAARDQWHPKTVKTLLNRLVKKGALGFRKEGRAYLYHPLVSEKDCVTWASESFLERVFGGSFQPMLAHFLENRRFSRAELDELKELLKRKEKK